jgi:hypothetical protein
LFNYTGSNFIEILQISWSFFINGGWVLFSIGLIYVLYRTYRLETTHQFVHSTDFIFLSIKVPRINTQSSLAVENLFAQLHALFAGLTFAQIYLEGRIQLWYSLEIISMGGKISFIIRSPASMRNVVEAAVYSQYPEAEITEVEDYMKNFSYDPDDSEFDIWGTEWKLDSDFVIPLKTYKDFEHPAAEEKILDPLSQHFESLAKMEPHEFFGVQIIIQPVNDDAWKPLGERKVKELTGEEVPHKLGVSDILLAPFNWFANFSFFELFFGGGHGHEEEGKNKPLNRWMNMTDVEKERVNAIERKIGKPGYKTKIRHLYIAPKDKFDPSKKSMLTGSYRPLGSVMTNKLKPDVSHTWTSIDYKFSPTLEKPYIDWALKRRKRFIFRGYKDRDIHIGLPMYILNTEEIATLYHFPMTTETRMVPAAVESTVSKKSQPPSDLPIAEL